jgi:hypothetical protein
MTAWAQRERLAIGIEPIDAIFGTRVTRAIHVDVERPGEPAVRSDTEGFRRRAGRDRPPMSRNDSGRHAMLLRGEFASGAVTSVQLRLYDRHRRWVPRRIEVPLPATTEVSTAGRIRRPVLYPGVAWDLPGGATTLRGCVRLGAGKAPVRWAWIEVRRPDADDIVLRTRADDRGEFLLLAGPKTVMDRELGSTFELVVRVFGPSTPAKPAAGEPDPLWDLPLETLAPPGTADDPIAAGRPTLPGQLPIGWKQLGEARVTLIPGRMVHAPTSFDF